MTRNRSTPNHCLRITSKSSNTPEKVRGRSRMDQHCGATTYMLKNIYISELLIWCPFYYICVKRDLFFLFASQPVSWSRYIKAGNGSNKRDKQRECLRTPIHAAVKRKCQIVNIIDMVCNLSISITYLGLSISFSI